jgi:hypothetical protein
MKNPRCFAFLMLILLLSSCAVSKKKYNPAHKFGRDALEQDYDLMRKILQDKHPSLYWYTSKDSMNLYFSRYRTLIKDSMTEPEFTWTVLAPLVNKIHCGHTSIEPSTIYERWLDDTKLITFPYNMKVWNDTMVVTTSVGGNVFPLKRGTIIQSINGASASLITSLMMDRLPMDGYAANGALLYISSNFPELHRAIFGISEKYKIVYQNESGQWKDTSLSAYFPDSDSTIRKQIKTTVVRQKKTGRHEMYRTMDIDSTGKFAYMKLNTFSEGRLRRFFHRNFKKLDAQHTPNLIVDLRYNGGGAVLLSTLFTRYLTRKPFRVADSAYTAIKSLAPFTSRYEYGMTRNLGLLLMASKKNDGLRHVKVYETKLYKPKKRHHYKGKIYLLVSGPTFSAATLVANALRGQEHVTLIGEETGGGAYGNSGISIPMVYLPNTSIRLRMPLFRLVQYNHQESEKGRGIIPDIIIPTSHEAIINGYDKKLKVLKDMIRKE